LTKLGGGETPPPVPRQIGKYFGAALFSAALSIAPEPPDLFWLNSASSTYDGEFWPTPFHEVFSAISAWNPRAIFLFLSCHH
tara:strand:- start:10464 stop:10709 length:246 start_codon:yes stop_codon:yes gene_type:complete